MSAFAREPASRSMIQRVRVYALVRNSCVRDARVLKEADALARRGYVVTIIAVLRDGAPPFEHRGGFSIVRVPIQPPHYRILRRMRSLPKWSTLMVRVRRRGRMWRAQRRERRRSRRRKAVLARAQRTRKERLRTRYAEIAQRSVAQRREAEQAVGSAAAIVGRSKDPMGRLTRRTAWRLERRETMRRRLDAGVGVSLARIGLELRARRSAHGRAARTRYRARCGAGPSTHRLTWTRTALRLGGLTRSVTHRARGRRIPSPRAPRPVASALSTLADAFGRAVRVAASVLGRGVRALARPVVKVLGPLLRVIGRPVGWLRRLVRPAVYAVVRWSLLRFHRQFILFDYSRRARDVIEADLRMHNDDQVVIHAHDLNALLTGVRAKRQFGGLLVYDSHELHLGTVGMMARNPLHRWVYARYERRYICHADAVITVCRSIGDILQRRYGVPRVDVVRNCPTYTPPLVRHDLLRRDLNIPDGWRIALYLGNVSSERGLEVVVRSVPHIGEGVSVVFLGSGPIVEDLRSLAVALGVEGRVHLHPPVGQDVLPRYVVSADVAVVPIQGRIPSYQYSLPNKLFESMMAGLPIAASNLPEIRRVVEEERVGAIFDPDDPLDVARTIRSVLDAPDYDAMRERALVAARERHNWSREVEQLAAVYDRLLRTGPPGERPRVRSTARGSDGGDVGRTFEQGRQLREAAR